MTKDRFGLDAFDELDLMDSLQLDANQSVRTVLPCDPCKDAAKDGLDEPEEVEIDDIGLGVESDLYDL